MNNFERVIDSFDIKRGRVFCINWPQNDRKHLESMVGTEIMVQGNKVRLIEVRYMNPQFTTNKPSDLASLLTNPIE
jgi:hypothetical protein